MSVLQTASETCRQPEFLRGVARLLRRFDHVTLEEFVPTRGLRVDLISLGPKGDIWIVECKSCRADFISDRKWHHYLPWCDRFFWAVDLQFPQDLLPENTGFIVADRFGGEIIRESEVTKLNEARRKVITRNMARVAARRLQQVLDPVSL